MPPRFLMIAAPASGSGKTTVTLGLLRAFARRGIRVASAKVGPDFIDPAFHAGASGRPCRNLDPWAMRPETLAAEAEAAGNDAELVLVEGVMGLFDGAAGGGGSSADLAALLGCPVLLVLDVRGQAASAAATAFGFARFRPEVEVAGLVLNRIGSLRHRELVAEGLAPTGLPLLGALPRRAAASLPSRHLGLVQACEHPDLDRFIEAAADACVEGIDLDAALALARPLAVKGGRSGAAIPPLGQRIAIARDPAFAFAYPHLLDGWRRAGAEMAFFSPLADEAPEDAADAVYLPGGYPELHADALAAAGRFRAGLRAAAAAGRRIYGECGGYLVLGKALTDADGVTHRMTGLLPMTGSYAEPQRRLGYRRIAVAAGTSPVARALGGGGARYRGHEFHFCTTREAPDAPALFEIADAPGQALGRAGLALGPVAGSFLHLIDGA